MEVVRLGLWPTDYAIDVPVSLAILTGMALGFGVGALVVYGSLSSLIATLGMNYMLRGLIMIITQGKSIALPGVRQTWLYPILTGDLSSFPTQIVFAPGHSFSNSARKRGDEPRNE